MAEVRKHGVERNVIQIDPSQFDFDSEAFIDTRETPAYLVDNSSSSRFIRLTKVEDRNFMIIQSFEVEFDDTNQPRPRRLSAGYAFPMKDGTLHALLTESGPPSNRSYLALSPDVIARPYGQLTKEGECTWRVTQQPFSEASDAFRNGARMEYWEKVTRESGHNVFFDVDKLSAQLDRTIWNFVP